MGSSPVCKLGFRYCEAELSFCTRRVVNAATILSNGDSEGNTRRTGPVSITDNFYDYFFLALAVELGIIYSLIYAKVEPAVG